ncbi:uncharacterized protein LOC132054159 [Lycium ferocissimum]|uniref:uncharacterized protein LOC132054159 n=1 Tax=Lycium ferocissimum TaxID=112874 RepID=UPI0028152F13|nr:uncharacterized protein LOC132054159 [Lycium ferocissimum]
MLVPLVVEIKSTPRNDSKRKRKETSTSKSKKVTDDSDFEEETEHPEAKKSKVEKGGAVKKTKVEKGETSKKKKVKKGETSKRKKVEICETSKRKKVEKGETSKRKKNNPTKKTQTHWCSYTNVEAPLEVKDRLNDAQLKLFRESPFGLFLDLPKLNVQPQLIRSLMYAETEHDRDDMFIINLNGKELRFGIREFAIVTGLKCGMDSEFVSDPDSPNRLMDMYFNGLTKVPKNDLIELFQDKKKEIGDADAFKIAILYFINTFLFSTESNKAFVPKLHFDLVESGEYMNYPWGNDCFKALLSSISHKLANDPTYYRFEGFPLAIQVWFYECCSKVDPTVATRIGNHFPRIFNWRTTSQRIYFAHLKKGMFKKYSNQLVFTNILPTDEEKVAINFMEFPEETAVKDVLEPQDPTQSSPSVRGSEFDALKKEVANVRKDLKSFEKKVGEQFVDMKDYMDKSIMNLLKDLKSMFGRQTETPEAKRSGSVKDVTKEPNTSNKKDGLQHNLYFDFDEPIGDFDIGGQDVGEQISNHMVVDASALKNGINASIPVGEQVGDGEACDKYIVDPEELKSHPIDTLISEHNLDDVVAGIDKLGALGNSATKIPTLDDFEMPPSHLLLEGDSDSRIRVDEALDHLYFTASIYIGIFYYCIALVLCLVV